MINTELYEFVSKSNYITPAKYIFGKNIYEYDIKQANIHALYCAGLLNNEQFNWLSNLPKIQREYQIGMMQRNNSTIVSEIKKYINLAKYYMVERNNIAPNSIMRIANDSLYIVTNIEPRYTTIELEKGSMTFINKNKFNSYMNIGALLFFDSESEFWNVDVKGINDTKLSLHKHFISEICTLLDARINGGKEIALMEFNKFYESYIKRQLPLEYYREFNSDSQFRLINNGGMSNYTIDYLSPYMTSDVLDIQYNQGILRMIYSYIMDS